MNGKLILAISIIVAFVVGFGAGVLVTSRIFFVMQFGKPPSGLPSGGSTSGPSPVNVIGSPFSSFKYAQYAYLISANATLSSSGKVATEDFNLTSMQLSNGSTKYSMKFDEVGTVYNVTMGRGSKLYYIDTNLADDMPGSDASFGDDGYVVVNSTGYIVAYQYPLPRT
ncbi:MAG: hypothetical protein ABSA33_01505 [Candidatus Micrarchaeaceae archaeon]